MTYQNDFTLPSEQPEQIATQGFEVLPELIRIVVNAAMQAERQRYPGVAPYQHSPSRQGRANGYKPKTVKTRMGEITFDVPQVHEGEFYPQALEKGLLKNTRGCQTQQPLVFINTQVLLWEWLNGHHDFTGATR